MGKDVWISSELPEREKWRYGMRGRINEGMALPSLSNPHTTSYLLLYPLSKCQSWIVVNHIIAQCNKRMNEWMNETIHESPSALGRAVESTRDIHSCKLPVRILTWPCWFEWPWLDSWILTAQAYGWRDHRDEAMKLWGQACKSGAKKRLCRLGWHWEQKKLNSIQRWASHLVDCTRGTSCWRRLRFT